MKDAHTDGPTDLGTKFIYPFILKKKAYIKFAEDWEDRCMYSNRLHLKAFYSYFIKL